MVTGKYSVLAFTLGLLCFGLSFSPATVLAETIGTPGYDLSATPPPPAQPTYTTIITGHVVDEDGTGVPGAIVTLWENGTVWQFTGKGHYARNDGDGTKNPQASGVLDPGSFIFGEVATNNYMIRAEKDGFIGASYFYVSMDTGVKSGELSFRTSETSVEVTLKGYHVPTFNSTQQSYGGAIAGAVYDKYQSHPTSTVSLWQNGKLVETPKNPQSSYLNGTFLFEHLAPGQYVVRVETNDVAGNTHNNSTVVTVANDPVTTDVIFTDWGMPPLPVHTLGPVPTPENNSDAVSTPIQSATLNTSTSSVPAPFPGTGVILMAMGMGAALVCSLRRSS